MKRLSFDVLVRNVAAQTDAIKLPLREVRIIVKAVRDQLRAALRRGEHVTLPKLLTLQVRTRRAHAVTDFRGTRHVLDESRHLRVRACKGVLK